MYNLEIDLSSSGRAGAAVPSMSQRKYTLVSMQPVIVRGVCCVLLGQFRSVFSKTDQNGGPGRLEPPGALVLTKLIE